MKNYRVSSSGIFLKSFFIFALSCLVYLFYFSQMRPGLYCKDVLDYINNFLWVNNVWDYFKSCFRMDFSVSAFYVFYILLFYSITKNLIALGLFQIVLASAINAYAWAILRKFSKTGIAWAVVLLLIFSPLNGIMTMWYHRSSLFAYLVFLNLILLYKFSKARKFNKLETTIFLINVLFLAFLRIDGIVISFTSLVIYILLSPGARRIKTGIITGYILLLTVYYLIPREGERSFYTLLPFTHQVRRIHQSDGSGFSDEDQRVLKGIVKDESDRKIWLEGNDLIYRYRDWEDGIFPDRVTQKESSGFIKWSGLFIMKHFAHYIKTQGETFLASSLFTHPTFSYFYLNRVHKNTRVYRELKEKTGIDYAYNNDFLEKIILFFCSKHVFLNALLFGVFVPFVFIFICFAIVLLKRNNKNILIPFIPLLLYALFLFLSQPLPKPYYWYWLAYSYYFIVIVLGYETVLSKRS